MYYSIFQIYFQLLHQLKNLVILHFFPEVSSLFSFNWFQLHAYFISIALFSLGSL